MPQPALFFLVLTLTAVGLAPGIAHLLELPVKLSYAPAACVAAVALVLSLVIWGGNVFGHMAAVANWLVGWLALVGVVVRGVPRAA